MAQTARPSDSARQPSPYDEQPISLWYRLPLLYIEPLCALHGAWLLFSSPSGFLDIVSPHALAKGLLSSTASAASAVVNVTAAVTAAASAVATPLPVSTAPAANLESFRVITDQLAIMQVFFAFNLAVVMRATQRNVGIWRLIGSGMLLSDILHFSATIREFGFAFLASPSRWRSHDWMNMIIIISMTLLRVGLVLGIGLPKQSILSDPMPAKGEKDKNN